MFFLISHLPNVIQSGVFSFCPQWVRKTVWFLLVVYSAVVYWNMYIHYRLGFKHQYY